MPKFTEEQIHRYARHIILPEVGGAGQRKLLDSRVLIVGAGGLGSPAALYLAAAGVGTLGIADFDEVDLTNLHRQIMHHMDDIGRPKVDSARDAMAAINPEVKVIPHHVQLASHNIMDVLGDYEVVLDCSDNFPTRYLVNDACVLSHKPLVYAGIYRFEGQAAVFAPPQGPCYRCLFPAPPPAGMAPSCQEAGVLGVLPGVLGVIQALEAIKLLLGIGRPLIGRLLFFDALALEFRDLQLARNPDCPVCGEHPTVTSPIDYELFCGARMGETLE